jgi:hypothetical protein
MNTESIPCTDEDVKPDMRFGFGVGVHCRGGAPEVAVIRFIGGEGKPFTTINLQSNPHVGGRDDVTFFIDDAHLAAFAEQLEAAADRLRGIAEDAEDLDDSCCERRDCDCTCIPEEVSQ